tara:strand:- start:6283 stop:8781 length:2499 start_codon:yes stop_codon:yes gene_type:complete
MAFLCPPSAPATPDYAAAATAQGTANRDTAITQGYLNNPNIVGPLGGQTVTFDATTNQPTITQTLTPTAQSTLDAQQRVQQGMANLGERGLTSASNIIGTPFQYTGPSGVFSLANSGAITGAPDLAKMGSATGAFTGTNAVGNATGGTATGTAASGQALGSVANPQAAATFAGGTALGGVTSGNATGNFQGGTATGGVSGPVLQQTYSNYGTVQGAPNLANYGSASSIGANQYGLAGGINADKYGLAKGGVEGVDLQQSLGAIGPINQNLNANNYLSNNQLDLRNVAQMPVNAGTTGQAAIMSRLAPQLERQQKMTAQNLANQGLVAGGEAYTNAMRDQSQQQNDLLTQAALQGISLDTAANQQGFGQALAAGQFGNLGQQQNFGNALAAQQAQNAAQGQGFNQQLQSGQFGNQAQLASFGVNLQNQQAQNQAIAQNYGQGLNAQQLANQSVAQNFGQGMTASNAANAAIQQNQNAALQQQAAANQAQAQQYGQAQGNAQFANQAQLAGFGANLQNQQAQNQAIAQNSALGLAQQQAANAAIGQNFGQSLQNQQAYNAAIGQNYQQGMGTQLAQNQAAAQNFGQNVTNQQLGNQATQQNFNNALATQQAQNQAIAQNFGQNVTSQQLANAAAGQNYQQGMNTQAAQNQALLQNQNIASQQQQLANAAQLQQYNQNLGAGQFGNQAATQELQKQLALRNQPLNEITGLMSGSQLQMPSFQGYNPTNITPAPIFAGAQAQGAAALQNYGIQQSGANATTSGLFSLAGAALSDRRLKSNIERIGTHKLGIGLYEYDILGQRQQGVMADEAEKVMPEAVLMHPSGYKIVNYGLLNG